MAGYPTVNSQVLIYALGGLGEVGKNMYCIEDDNNLILIDAGVMFPEESVLGINYVIPDYTYLKENRWKLKALFITHGHEDHIGGIPFLVQSIHIPVIYAPKLAAALIKHKLEENGIRDRINIVEIDESSIIDINNTFNVSFFHMTHSIPDSYGICVDTPQGRIVTTGDFKVDLTPVDTDISLSRIAQIGDQGVDLLLSDSTNAEKLGYTPSEKSVINSINEVFTRASGRLIISTFSSNVSRIQQIVEAAVAHKRKIIVIGRSMDAVISMARKYGYIHIPDSALLSAEDVKTIKSNDVCILCTGSQGEPLAALSRIANNEHPTVKIQPRDTIVFSSSPIPGNAASINRVVNKLTRLGANVLTNSVLSNLHASGHPSQEELKLILKLFKPKYFMPVHGEYRMLRIHAEIATKLGVPKENTFVLGNGDTLVLFHNKITPGRRIQADDIYIDGKDISGLSTAVIKDRKLLSEDGMVSVLVALDSKTNTLLMRPKIISAGFLSESEKTKLLFDKAITLLEEDLLKLLADKVTFGEIKNTIRNSVSQYLYVKTHRKPMVIPLVMNKL